MKTFAIYLILILQGALCATAQNSKNSTLAMQATKLKSFLDQHAIEKAYLHFDKPYYAAGDTIYFKAYLVAGEKNELSQLSGVLYADLITPQNKIGKSVKLQLNNGLAWGDFALPDSIPGGKYRVRAYTKLMQSYGSELFFDRQIPVAAIDTKLKKLVLPVRQKSPLPGIQFFPEGGDLVTGVNSRIAFKAINADGLGIGVTGKVLSRENKVVASFSSMHLGMGAFSLVPASSDSYHAELLYADGTKSTVELPAANPAGVAIAVADSGSKISVHINPGSIFYQQNFNKSLGLFIYNGGKLITVSDVMDGTDMRFDIQKKGLRSGITQITLLSAAGEPLCERLLFISKDDNLSLQIATDKASYPQRGKVKVDLHVDMPAVGSAAGHFSVAVIDKSKVQIDEDKAENILTYLLLTSSLKGFIEDPGYYFNHTNADKFNHLDLVMLTHGYRRFTWKNIVNNDVPPVAIVPEKGLSIEGTAKSLWGKPVHPGLVTLLPPAGGALINQQTDENGSFSFSNLVFYDTTRFVLNAVNKKGGNNTQLIYRGNAPAPVTPPVFYTSADTSSASILQAYLDNSKSRHQEFLKYDKGIQLKEVKIKAYKKATYRTQSLAGAGNADQVMFGKDLIPGSLPTALNGRLRGGVKFTDDGVPISTIDRGGALLVVIDGTISGVPLKSIVSGDVETVELLSPITSRGAIYGMEGAHGVLIITTKNGGGRNPDDIIARGVLPLTLTGFYRAREFYAPVYDHAASLRPDLRSTIYWQPEITTDAKGNASFEFYNADGEGEYEVIIEGMTAEGTAGIARYSYKVTE